MQLIAWAAMFSLVAVGIVGVVIEPESEEEFRERSAFTLWVYPDVAKRLLDEGLISQAQYDDAPKPVQECKEYPDVGGCDLYAQGYWGVPFEDQVAFQAASDQVVAWHNE